MSTKNTNKQGFKDLLMNLNKKYSSAVNYRYRGNVSKKENSSNEHIVAEVDSAYQHTILD
jgi:hypothetical protein